MTSLGDQTSPPEAGDERLDDQRGEFAVVDGDLIDLVRDSFQPSSPVKTRDLFAGRTEQMNEIADLVDQTGQHGAVFGERGVGKTSLARVMTDILSTRTQSIKVNCTAADTFKAIWQRVLGDLALAVTRPSPGFRSTPNMEAFDAAELLPKDLGPDELRRVLAHLVATLGRPLVVFLDEFDRIEDEATRTAFADTLKALTDQDVDVTVILVGVANNISELVTEHQSIERNLIQVAMPRMSSEELKQIVRTGLSRCGMTIDDAALDSITSLSLGLPHYTHLLAQRAALRVVEEGDEDRHIERSHVEVAIKQALSAAQQSVRDAYIAATQSNRDESLYRQVLLACALARTDESGFFKAADVRDPLTGILGKRVDIPQYAQHLKAFCGARGSVLERRGPARQVRYRFASPIMQPYVLMRGVEDGLITAAQVQDR